MEATDDWSEFMNSEEGQALLRKHKEEDAKMQASSFVYRHQGQYFGIGFAMIFICFALGLYLGINGNAADRPTVVNAMFLLGSGGVALLLFTVFRIGGKSNFQAIVRVVGSFAVILGFLGLMLFPAFD